MGLTGLTVDIPPSKRPLTSPDEKLPAARLSSLEFKVWGYIPGLGIPCTFCQWLVLDLTHESQDTIPGTYPRWHVSFNITMLRLISFSMDCYWACEPQPPEDVGNLLPYPLQWKVDERCKDRQAPPSFRKNSVNRWGMPSRCTCT